MEVWNLAFKIKFIIICFRKILITSCLNYSHYVSKNIFSNNTESKTRKAVNQQKQMTLKSITIHSQMIYKISILKNEAQA